MLISHQITTGPRVLIIDLVHRVHFQIKTCSRDPSPPPYEYVKGGGGIFNDMAVHDLDMTRFLAGTDPIEILAVGSCHIDKSIEDLPGSEAFDTASCIVRYPGGVNAMVDVCRQSSYGYDQRAEVLGTKGMIATDNVYPNTAKIYKQGGLITWFPFFPSLAISFHIVV
jgi:myo-inositol 2-dehydrogenase/D-chiro-inositol 1-dehydrogenase